MRPVLLPGKGRLGPLRGAPRTPRLCTCARGFPLSDLSAPEAEVVYHRRWDQLPQKKPWGVSWSHATGTTDHNKKVFSRAPGQQLATAPERGFVVVLSPHGAGGNLSLTRTSMGPSNFPFIRWLRRIHAAYPSVSLV